MKFLVIQQKMIGDVLASTVICESLKYHFPEAEVHLVANENTLAVLQGNPFIDEIIVFKNAYRNSKKQFLFFLKSLKKTNYTATLDAYGKLESNLITLFAKADKKIGNRKWYTSWIYSHIIAQKTVSEGEIPLAISNRLMLLEPLERVNGPLFYPKLFLTSQEITTAKKNISVAFDQEESKLIMISIVGSAPHKTYPARYMAEILDLICETATVKMLFNYIPKQREDALAIFNLCAPKTQDRIALDFYAESLRGFIGLLSQCDMLIGNEGGAVNMAKALDIPSFSIFSPFIKKNAWHGAVYKDHASVHLSDYHPELLKEMTRKKIKEKSAVFYEAYKPELFAQALLAFLKQNTMTSLTT